MDLEAFIEIKLVSQNCPVFIKVGQNFLCHINVKNFVSGNFMNFGYIFQVNDVLFKTYPPYKENVSSTMTYTGQELTIFVKLEPKTK